MVWYGARAFAAIFVVMLVSFVCKVGCAEVYKVSDVQFPLYIRNSR